MESLLPLSPARSAAGRPPRTLRLRGRAGLLVPAVALAGLAALQEGLARGGAIDPARFPPISRVLAALAGEAASGRLWPPLGDTGLNWLVSLCLSFALALLLAVALGGSAWLRELSAPLIGFLRPMPCTALIPLVILSLGANARGCIFLTTFGAVWQMLPMLTRGVAQVDSVAHDTARVFGFTGWQVLRWITLPTLEPYMLTALRIGASASLVLLIGMELLTGASGIGRVISVTYAGSNLTLMYAYVALSGVLGMAANLLLGRLATQRARRHGGAR